MTPEWLEKIEKRNEALGNFEIPDTEEGRLLAKIFYSHFSDQSALLSHIHKLREALESVQQICGAANPSSFNQIKEAVQGAGELANEPLLHNPMKGGV